MSSIKFFIQSPKSPATVYVRFRQGKDIDAKAKTPYSVNPQMWSNTKGQPKDLKDENNRKLHCSLETLHLKILSSYNDCVGKRVIDSFWLKGLIYPEVAKDGPPEKLVDYFDYYLERKKSSLAASSYSKMNSKKALLMRFQKATRTEYRIVDVNGDFKLAFERYCRDKGGYSQNTISRAIKFVKTICIDARNNGLPTHFQLNSLKAPNEKTEIIYLKFEELDKIAELPLQSEALDTARDWLLISCETGQRVSDFLRFTKAMIFEERGSKFIRFTQQKTGKLMMVPLSRKVFRILEKRNGEFPRKMAEQNYNLHIKQVCKLAGIDTPTQGGKIDPKTNRKVNGVFPKYELVASHIGRRSYASNYEGKHTRNLTMAMTGHTTESSFLAYIGKPASDKAHELAAIMKTLEI